MFPKRMLKRALPGSWKIRMREFLLTLDVTHVWGPRAVNLSRNEAAVTCVVKNGQYYLPSFIKHYMEMGFRHIFFLDNGSSDDTISFAQRYKNVTVFESKLPIDTHQRLFKKYLAQKCIVGGWCLDADIDEYFDYPYSDIVTLNQFIEYLNANAYTAVVTQLLDLFSDEPLSRVEEKIQENGPKGIYKHYDISNIKVFDYRSSEIAKKYGSENEISNCSTALYFGGIRDTLYGNNCLLTKHSFFLPREGLDLFPHVHFVNRARLADLSCVMRHYKLTSNALNIAIQNRQGFSTNAKGYDDFIIFLTKRTDHQIKRDSAANLESVNDLVKSNFLFISEQYKSYVNALSSRVAKNSKQPATRGRGKRR